MILLTALILYDYSAQSLVDRDIISFGKTLMAEQNSMLDTKSVNLATGSSLNIVQEDSGAELIAKLVGSTDETSVGENQISYHALANLNPVTAINANVAAEEKIVAVHISTPSPFVETTVAAPELSVPDAVETKLSLTLATVSASASPLLMSGLEGIEVKDELTANGMQFADSDNDYMFDFEDKCPAIAGVARFEGCPVPDSDADGINDEEDRCPFEAGVAASGGCVLQEDLSINYSTLSLDNTVVKTNTLLTLIQFEEHSEILSTDDFNRVLKLADKVLNGAASGIELVQSADTHSAKKINTVTKYLKDLGVKDTQIIVAKKNSENLQYGGVVVKVMN